MATVGEGGFLFGNVHEGTPGLGVVAKVPKGLGEREVDLFRAEEVVLPDSVDLDLGDVVDELVANGHVIFSFDLFIR
jgi:hypothetical protein